MLKTAYWNSAGVTHSALTEEPTLLSFVINHQLNTPAMAVIVLADADGSIARKYDVDTNAVYVGSGRVQLEYPTATTVFDGRILKARHDSSGHRVVLMCEDWLHQLSDDRINYHMAEDLDGSGLRQSTLKAARQADPTTSIASAYTNGADYYVFDDDMGWDVDEWNTGHSLIIPMGHTGDQKTKVGPYTFSGTYDTTIYPSPNSLDLDLMWVEDDDYITLTKTAQPLVVSPVFRTFGPSGSLAGIEQSVVMNLVYKAYDASGDGVLAYWNVTLAAWKDIDTVLNGTDINDPFRKITITMPAEQVTELLSGGDLVTLRITMPSAAGETPIILIDEWTVEVGFTIDDGHGTAIDIEDTFGIVNLEGAWLRDPGDAGNVDEIDDMRDPGVGDVALLPAIGLIDQDDAFYIGFGDRDDVYGVRLNISTAGAGVYSGTWQYYNGAWVSIPSVTDGSNDFKNAGTVDITFPKITDWSSGTFGVGGIQYWIRLLITTAFPTITTQPLATQGWALRANTMEVDTDCSVAGLGLWEGCPYQIAKTIYRHIDSAEGGTLITGGDSLVTLTCAASIEHTSGVTTKSYKERTRLEILRDLVKMDKAVFWIELGTTTVSWKNVTDGASTAITDASVLAWSGGEYSYNEMKNEYHVYGIRIGDDQLYTDSTTIAGGDPGATSKTKYGLARTGAVMSAGTSTEYDTIELASSLVERDLTVPLFLTAVLEGFHACRLGDWWRINSTYLGLTDADYVITHWSFDSSTYRTKVRLHPRGTDGYMTHIGPTEQMGWVVERGKETELDKHTPGPTSQTW